MSTTPSTDTDPWDRPLDDGRKAAISARHKERAALSNAIPDDWDEETSSSGEEDNQQIIWDNANKQVPMPQLVVTSPRTGSISPGVVPPASAFQSPIRILKRSTAPAPTQKKMKGGDASDSSSSSSPASAASTSAGVGAGGTFAERSARYNAARERIFAAAAGTTDAGAGAGPGVGIGNKGEGVTGGAIIRNPKGPQGPNGQGKEGSQGFGIRTGKWGSSGQPSEKPGRQLQDSGLGTE